MKNNIFTSLVVCIITLQSFAQTNENRNDSLIQHRFALSIPYLNLTNFSADYAIHNEAHFGYRLTNKDLVGIKIVGWKLVAPLGIPIGPSLANEDENYDGRLNEFGVGAYYQRFLWKGLYTSLEVVPLKKKYINLEGDKIDDGFRLYTSLHVGYYIPLFKNRVFIQPQIHFNYWPINTDSPNGFAEQDRKWNNNYFLFEPNLYIGINF